MALPTVLYALLAEEGLEVRAATALAGGIHEAAHIQTAYADYFIKWRFGGDAVAFEREADGIRLLREPGVITIPTVDGVRHRSAGAVADKSISYIWMTYFEPSAPRDPVTFRDRFAEELARLHRSCAGEMLYGFPADNYIGHLPQPNRPQSPNWATFYRDCRLLPQIRIARGRQRLNPERERLLMQLLDRLPHLLDELPEEVSLIHGDLWSGNYLCWQGESPVLFDPAAYFGHREIEIAYIELFGGFPPGFVDAYNAVCPLDKGYSQRRSLHQLYPLLVHLNHFGEKYGPPVEAICREYVG